ncbi:MAG: DinB family protein [Bacteroidia bacterium]|jgi:uncharacterized damage-inducible protein DinB|nr:DinB family protein [Bacteroidia bacterium]
MSATPITDAWHTNCRHTQFLLHELTQEQLDYRQTPRSKTIASQFRHIAMMRKYWLETLEPATGKSIAPPDADTTNPVELAGFLTLTANHIARLLETAETTGKLKGYKAGPTMFLAYVCAHEGHHRGQILLYLKTGGLPFDKAKSYKLWEWK